MSGATYTFEAPGPGAWMLDTTHHGRRPVTACLRSVNAEAWEGMAEMCARFGLPIAGFDVRVVHGCEYLRPRAVGEPANPKSAKAPPAWLMKVVSRVHPEMRRRNAAAATAWSGRAWRDDVDLWFGEERRRVVDANLGFQRTDLDALDDAALADHIEVLVAHLHVQARLGMRHHGGDIIPVGDFMAHCAGWGIPMGAAAALLRGASPASVETALLLAPVAAALAVAPAAPRSIDEIRALGAASAAAVDEWLEQHAWRLVTSDDLDGVTLAERPDLQLAALLAATAPPPVEPPDTSEVRARVPAAERALFDDLVAEARYGLRQRDDCVGVRWNWAGGLLRRALLDAGRRAVAAGRLDDPEHAVELGADEVRPFVQGGGPSADELAGRRSVRRAVEAAGPPTTLGPDEAPPPFDALPQPMARAARAMMAMIAAMEGEPGGSPLHGVGVGAGTYRGTARVVSGADDAFERLRPGDVLVASFTGPSYNSILPLVGALVVEEGGPMCHAAIVAREFGLPAVVGALDATSAIRDDDEVEVDAVAGAVRVVSRDESSVSREPRARR